MRSVCSAARRGSSAWVTVRSHIRDPFLIRLFGMVFAVPQVFQVLAQVAPYKAFGAGDKNFHALLSSFSISWMYSVVSILAMVSSTFRRRVLWLV